MYLLRPVILHGTLHEAGIKYHSESETNAVGNDNAGVASIVQAHILIKLPYPNYPCQPGLLL